MFDLRKSNLLTKKIKLIEPDFIFHLAAQSLVKKSYDDPVTTWQSNLISTLNLLESLRHKKKKIKVVIITSYLTPQIEINFIRLIKLSL